MTSQTELLRREIRRKIRGGNFLPIQMGGAVAAAAATATRLPWQRSSLDANHTTPYDAAMRECHDCGATPVKRARCPECAERHRLQERKRKNRLREEGRCIFCGDPLLDPERTLCGRCCARKRALRRELLT